MEASLFVLAAILVLRVFGARLKPLPVCSAFLTISCCLAQSAKVEPGSIAGEVFTKSADGQRELVPGAHITLRSAVERQTESDAIGRYRFDQLPPGRYTADATAPGLNGSAAAEVRAGEIATIEIPMELTAVTSSVNVTATESAMSAVETPSAQSTTIAQSTRSPTGRSRN